MNSTLITTKEKCKPELLERKAKVQEANERKPMKN
jgi:hypothetical protein